MIGGQQPNPAHTKGDACVVQFADTKAAKFQGHANPPPVDRTMASCQVFPTVPKELADDLIHLLEHVGIEDDGRELVPGMA